MPEEEKAQVLAYIRFLRVYWSKSDRAKEDFLQAVEEAQATAQQAQITGEDIAREIRTVREGK